MSQDSTNLDMLRALAVLLVLGDHFLKIQGLTHIGDVDINWIGRLGVAFFFVHTSLVLMLSLDRAKETGWPRTRSFYIRRLFRIYPLSCFFVLLVSILGIPQARIVDRAFETSGLTLREISANVTLTQNLTGDANILGQLWSLPIEVDMYLLLPFLYFLASRSPKRFLYVAWPIAVMSALLVGSIPRLWRLSFASFAPCFVPGVMAFALCRKCSPRLNRLLWPVFLILLVWLFMLHASLKSSWMICLLLGLAVPFFKEQTNTVVNALTYRIAKYSYGIYLGHTLCLWLAFAVLRSSPWPARYMVFAVAIVAIPWAAYVFVEHPGIQAGKRLSERLATSPARRDRAPSHANSTVTLSD